MSIYRKKPVVVEAVQWTGENYEAIQKFCDKVSYEYPAHKRVIFIQTLEGDHRADAGDWIIKGVKGEFYPCKPDIFEQTYEKVKE